MLAVLVGQGDWLIAPFRSLAPWPVLLLAGVAAAGLSSLLFLTAIRQIGGTRTGILMLFEPVVGRAPRGAAAAGGAGAGPARSAGRSCSPARSSSSSARRPSASALVEAGAGPVV